jgi:uncharacterized protein YecT (DUF1311 family)
MNRRMTSRTIVAVITLTCFFSNASAIDEAVPKQYSDCQGWPDTSSFYEGCMSNHETKDLLKEIEAIQKQIIKYSKPEARKQFQKSITAWEAYLKQACEVQEMVMGGINGVSSARCYNSLTRQRLSYLKESF